MLRLASHAMQSPGVASASNTTFYKQTIIWAKGGGGMGDLEGQYALDYEMALFCVKGSPKFQGKRGMAVWEIGKDKATDYVHPTQKPVALAEQALVNIDKHK
jgi:DNA modification methylase